MKRVTYLLHNFPGITDTFIKREIRSLQKAGTEVNVISVWKPKDAQTTSEIMAQWAADTHFVLPRPALSIVTELLASLIRQPLRFTKTLALALTTARPGLRGLAFQIFYFCEAVLVAEIMRQKPTGHLHNHIGDQSGTVTMLTAKLTGVPYSITFHGWPVFFDGKYSRIKEKVLAAKFTRAISYFCRSQLMMFSESDDPAPFKIIHCGLSMPKYTFRLPPKQVKTLFCAARLSPEKGLTFLFRALKDLTDSGYDLTLTLAGNGPSFEQLKKLAADLGIANRVVFLGFLNEAEIIGALAASDLFVLPSYVEGVPVSAMEAMAIGVPVIATNIAGTSELVESGVTGILVRPSDAQALKDAIVKLMNDYPLRLLLAERARQKVVDEFDVDKETAKLNDCLLQD